GVSDGTHEELGVLDQRRPDFCVAVQLRRRAKGALQSLPLANGRRVLALGLHGQDVEHPLNTAKAHRLRGPSCTPPMPREGARLMLARGGRVKEDGASIEGNPLFATIDPARSSASRLSASRLGMLIGGGCGSPRSILARCV